MKSVVKKYPFCIENYTEYLKAVSKYDCSKTFKELFNTFSSEYTGLLSKDYKNTNFIPKCKEDLTDALKEYVPLDGEHICFNDLNYLKRKYWIMSKSLLFDLKNDSIPIINYTDEENDIWKGYINVMLEKIKTNACEEYTYNIQKMFNSKILKIDKLTELAELNSFLEDTSNFNIVPVSGLLSPRIFLYFLSFRIFTSTQYVRIKEGILFNGEPDYFHEVIGHITMLSNKKFADFTEKIGKASIGASDEIIKELINIYWFTIEFGLIREKNKLKVYGAGILAGPKEIDEFDKGLEAGITYHKLDFKKMQTAYYDYYNPNINYFVSESIEELHSKIDSYIQNISSMNKRI